MWFARGCLTLPKFSYIQLSCLQALPMGASQSLSMYLLSAWVPYSTQPNARSRS